MELTAEDKTRIKQEAKDRLDEYENRKRFIQGAEYEHKYQREKRKLWNDENNNLIKELGRRDGKIQQLEAERSNIETLLHKILKESVGGNVPFSFELYNEIKAALNL